MTKDRKTVLRILIFAGIPVIASVVVLALLLFKPFAPDLDVTGKEISDQEIYPVMYFEENIGNIDYNTLTYLIKGNDCIELEKHYRTFSKNHPESALDSFGGMDEARKNCGQLMSYYNCAPNEVFVFDKSLSQNGVREYLVVKGERETVIEYANGEFFSDFLSFGGSYYLFTYAYTSPELSDYDVIRIYRMDDELRPAGNFEIDFSAEGIPTHNFLLGSTAVSKDAALFPLKKDGSSYFLKYDFSSGETSLLSRDYGLLGIIADSDRFYAVGFANGDKLVFETLSSDGASLYKSEISLPAAVQMSREDYSFDESLYMYGSEIYCCFTFGERTCFLSYDISENQWKNSWVAETGDNLLMDVKFMIKEGDGYFDLFPNLNNKSGTD